MCVKVQSPTRAQSLDEMRGVCVCVGCVVIEQEEKKNLYVTFLNYFGERRNFFLSRIDERLFFLRHL